MAGAPALALMHASAPPSASPPHVVTGELAVASVAPAHPLDDAVAPSTPAADEPTTTVPPVTSTTTVSVVPTTTARRVTTTTAPRHTSTTVKAAPKQATPTTRPAPKSGSGSGAGSTAPAGNTQSGGATWYDAAPPGTCAHKTLPMGTIVTIHASNGATATCKVSDRGPYANGMIIDLAKDVFEQLAPLSQGVVQVTISW